MQEPIHLQEDEFFIGGQAGAPPARVDARYGNGKMLGVRPLRDGLAVEGQHFSVTTDVRIIHYSASPSVIMFYTCLSGDIAIRYPKRTRRTATGFSGVEVLGHEPVLFTDIQSRVPVQTLCVYVDPTIFSELGGKGSDDLLEDLNDLEHRARTKGATLRRSRALDAAMRMCAFQALQAALNTPDDALFLEAKALELISHQLRQIDMMAGRTTAPSPLRASDMDRVVWAGDILRKEMAEPPDGTTLAHRVGLSYGRMLRGFKDLLNMTPVEYLRAMRLQKAHDLIASRRQNITEAAFSVGYSSLSHFTKAFRNEFGVNPKECAKRGKRVKCAVSSKIVSD